MNKAIQFDQVYVGPLKRHHQTYEKVKEAYLEKGLDFPTAIEIEELREYEAMDYMESLRDELSTYYPRFRQWYEEMDKQPSHRTKMKMVLAFLQKWATDTLEFQLPEGMQTFAQFRRTAEIGLQKVLKGNEKGKTIAVFSSGGCIGAMMAKIVGVEDSGKAMGFNMVMLNTAITEVLFSGNRLSLQTFNTLPHLKEEMITTM